MKTKQNHSVASYNFVFLLIRLITGSLLCIVVNDISMKLVIVEATMHKELLVISLMSRSTKF